MPEYPDSIADAILEATNIAQRFDNGECVECAKAIVLEIGPYLDTSVVKLLTSEGQGIVICPSRGLLVSTTGQHIGVCIEGDVYDNHDPNGIRLTEWRELYKDILRQPLNLYERETASFFDSKFIWQRFAGFCSNRFQSYD